MQSFNLVMRSVSYVIRSSHYLLFVRALFMHSFILSFYCVLCVCSFYALFLHALFMRSFYGLFFCALFIRLFYALFSCAILMYSFQTPGDLVHAQKVLLHRNKYGS